MTFCSVVNEAAQGQVVLERPAGSPLDTDCQLEYKNSIVVIPANETIVQIWEADENILYSTVENKSNAMPLPRGSSTGNWPNIGGNPQRNGMSSLSGPNDDKFLWENDDDFALVTFPPYIYENLFAVRLGDFITNQVDDPVVAYDFETGNELWRELLPFAGNSNEEWSANILGVDQSAVYVSRSGNGNSVETTITALDAKFGFVVWETTVTVGAGPSDGVVFAPNGDLIVGSFNKIQRISHVDGAEVWMTPRSCPTSGGCAPVINDHGVYINSPAVGGTEIEKYDLETGEFLYKSQTTSGIITQNAPFLSLDGSTVYHAKQQSSNVNFLYAFDDTGDELQFKWMVPIAFSAFSFRGIGTDGTIYTLLANDELVGLDPETGNEVSTAGILQPSTTRVVISTAANGNVYYSNGSTADGGSRVWAFTANLTTELFELQPNRVNSGGPALGSNLAGDVILTLADRNGVTSYQLEKLIGDVNRDGSINLLDIAPFVELVVEKQFDCNADINRDGIVNLLDVAPFVDLLSD